MSEIEIKKVADRTLKTADNLGIATEKAKGITLKAKEKVSKNVSDNSESPVNYAIDKVQDNAKNVSEDAIYLFKKQGKKSVNETVKNTKKLEQSIEEVRAKRKIKKDKSKINNPDRYTPKAQTETVKTDDNISKNTPKNTQNKVRSAISIKTKETVSAVKSNQPIIKASKQSAKDTAKAINKSSQIAKETAKKSAKGAKKAARATKRAIKAMIESTKALVNAIIAGGWVSVVIIILICLVAALCSSFYGIFFSSETSQSGMNITSVIQQINNEFDDKIDEIKSSGSFDGVEVIGNRSNWKDVLSIYAVKTTTDENNPMEVATVDENKKSILSSIFWDMNKISKSVETRTETVTKESTDGQGNKIETTEQVEKKYLVITLSGKTADDMANSYSFNDTQKKYLAELMSDKNNKLWASLIYNIGRVSGGSGIDIKDLDFSNETVNDTQKKIVAVATNSAKYGISARSGYCQAWVADVYQAVTGSRGSAHCALCAADMWAVSSDFSQIPVGATVYGYSSSKYGHVGIYIGKGMVAHNIGEIKIQSLESWIKAYKGFAWGWENTNKL
ncbi:MAG: CHAP domain-containing protein [Eubacteriales bacterium]|nr:CHAP domain-containing protein [Eubacteriales bacterium]